MLLIQIRLEDAQNTLLAEITVIAISLEQIEDIVMMLQQGYKERVYYILLSE